MLPNDLIFLMGAGALDVSFLPTLFGKFKPALWTSITFTVVMAAFTANFMDMDMPLATAMHTLATLMWGITIFQKREKSK